MTAAWDSRLHPLPRPLQVPAGKERSRHQAIEAATLPELLRLPLELYGQRRAIPCVRVGQRVRRGEVVARGPEVLDAAVHATTSGRIRAVAETPLPCIELEADGEDAAVDPEPLADWRARSRPELLTLLAGAGLAGLGGAGFPSAAKLAAAEGIDLLIINAAECEPLLTADERLLTERAGEVLTGIDVLAHLTAARRVVIAIEDDKPEAIAALGLALQQHAVSLAIIPRGYPSGSERQLVQILTGREIPSGRLPVDLGILCHNVASAWAMGRAVVGGEALTERIVTVSGAALLRPGNLLVRLGTPVGHLLAQRGIDHSRLSAIWLGGPLTGRAVTDQRLPVGKTHAGLLAAGAEELAAAGVELPCIRCGACAEVCPASLLPQDLHRQARAADLDALTELNLVDCIECGACAWVCPSRIPLVEDFRLGKAALAAEARRHAVAEHARLRHERRQQRLEQERLATESAREARLSRVDAALARAKAAQRDRQQES
ncbi:MAG: electron transport complex subunit RsxC [Gammaproteobacteria bacterium]|nr:electron transport complex subunit RsxC [Gammaproteobacteria bacterium]